MNENQLPMWLQYLSILGPITVGLVVGLVSVLVGLYINNKTLNDKRREDQKRDIYKKLNEFYSPFEQLRKKSLRLYTLFVENKEGDFRTLTALLRGDEFSGNDKMILDEIISIDNQLENLIIAKSGLVDNENFRDLLAQAATHFHIISQAYEGRLTGEPERFKEYVFPRELDEKVTEQINTLKAELIELNK
jgi:hypothetical protein